MKAEVIKDLSTLTSIQVASLQRLSDLVQYDICHTIQENMLDIEPISEIDLGFGTLLIKLEDDSVKYKFIPSNALETNIKETVTKKKNPLIAAVDSSLVQKIEHCYKELL